MAEPDANAVKIFSNASRAIPFMKGTLVKAPSITSEKEYGRAMNLTFIKLHDTCTLNGAPISVYAVRKAENGEPSFKSYLCPYSRGELSYTVLGHEADFCFTFAMDGCTFSVGSPTGTGEVVVTHGNAAGNDEGAGDQTNKQNQFARDFHKAPGVTLLEPTTYRPANSGKIATTFGVREAGTWTFHYLSYTITKRSYPFAYDHLGVHQFA